MKIQIEFVGLPSLSDIIGKKREIELAGRTISDLIMHLAQRYGQEVRRILLDPNGDLDLTIQVMVNDDGFVWRKSISRRMLKQGDRVTFLLFASGG